MNIKHKLPVETINHYDQTLLEKSDVIAEGKKIVK